MRRAFIPFFSLILMACLITPAQAQKYSIYNTELANGLDVIVIENPVVPLV